MSKGHLEDFGNARTVMWVDKVVIHDELIFIIGEMPDSTSKVLILRCPDDKIQIEKYEVKLDNLTKEYKR